MSSSGIGPKKDPWERNYRVEEVGGARREEGKRGKGGPPQEFSEGASHGLIVFFLLFLEKILNSFKQSIRKAFGTVALTPAEEALLLIKAAFEMMMREDRSQDVLFLRGLANLWQGMLESSIERQTNASWANRLKELIKDIESYPKNEEYTFGYYLNEHAGQKWLPFPYMELIQKLHHQYEVDPPSSFLFRWTHMIEEILRNE